MLIQSKWNLVTTSFILIQSSVKSLGECKHVSSEEANSKFIASHSRTNNNSNHILQTSFATDFSPLCESMYTVVNGL